jgi:hypothetical protein
MNNNIDHFNKRWTAIEKEVLSSVRRQMKGPSFDNDIISRDYKKACNEWFNGKLAPSIWFKELANSEPDKALAFRDYINSLQLKEKEVSKPNRLWSFFLTVLSVPVTYLVLNQITEWEFWGKSVFSIGFAVLVWTAFQSRFISKSSQYEDSIVDFYHEQLEKHGEMARKILL